MKSRVGEQETCSGGGTFEISSPTFYLFLFVGDIFSLVFFSRRDFIFKFNWQLTFSRYLFYFGFETPVFWITLSLSLLLWTNIIIRILNAWPLCFPCSSPNNCSDLWAFKTASVLSWNFVTISQWKYLPSALHHLMFLFTVKFLNFRCYLLLTEYVESLVGGLRKNPCKK